MTLRFRISKLLNALTIAFAVVLAWSGPASAHASPDDFSWISSVKLGTHIDGNQQVTLTRVPGDSPSLPKPPQGTHYPEYVLVGHVKDLPGVSQAAVKSSVSPNSASKCNPTGSAFATCIEVTGSGLTVSNWTTDAYFCSCAAGTVGASYIVNTTVLEVLYQPWYGAGRYQSRFDDLPRSWKDGTKLCNYWGGSEGGTPCITVHS
ncbi:hypothetical protein [Streptomyces sp. CBMA29]|uniref:hypothetical protein n=1 Tax=Streptomyces sp. CBMA29 TaxID=1896314 RepID=UPI001661EC4C|nr:hypothetical protein [Streptomyces sp. CBMA29]